MHLSFNDCFHIYFKVFLFIKNIPVVLVKFNDFKVFLDKNFRFFTENEILSRLNTD